MHDESRVLGFLQLIDFVLERHRHVLRAFSYEYLQGLTRVVQAQDPFNSIPVVSSGRRGEANACEVGGGNKEHQRLVAHDAYVLIVEACLAFSFAVDACHARQLTRISFPIDPPRLFCRTSWPIFRHNACVTRYKLFGEIMNQNPTLSAKEPAAVLLLIQEGYYPSEALPYDAVPLLPTKKGPLPDLFAAGPGVILGMGKIKKGNVDTFGASEAEVSFLVSWCPVLCLVRWRVERAKSSSYGTGELQQEWRQLRSDLPKQRGLLLQYLLVYKPAATSVLYASIQGALQQLGKQLDAHS